MLCRSWLGLPVFVGSGFVRWWIRQRYRNRDVAGAVVAVGAVPVSPHGVYGSPPAPRTLRDRSRSGTALMSARCTGDRGFSKCGTRPEKPCAVKGNKAPTGVARTPRPRKAPFQGQLGHLGQMGQPEHASEGGRTALDQLATGPNDPTAAARWGFVACCARRRRPRAPRRRARTATQGYTDVVPWTGLSRGHGARTLESAEQPWAPAGDGCEEAARAERRTGAGPRRGPAHPGAHHRAPRARPARAPRRRPWRRRTGTAPRRRGRHGRSAGADGRRGLTPTPSRGGFPHPGAAWVKQGEMP